MLGHIRSGTLDKFKEAFDKALNGGEGFSVAAHSCTKIFMTQFDEQSAGTFTKFKILFVFTGCNFVFSSVSWLLKCFLYAPFDNFSATSAIGEKLISLTYFFILKLFVQYKTNLNSYKVLI